MKRSLAITGVIFTLATMTYGQISADASEINLVLSADESVFYAKSIAFDYFSFNLDPSASLEFGTSGSLGVAASGVIIKSVLADDADVFQFSLNSVKAFGRIRLLEKEATTLYGSLLVQIPLGTDVASDSDEIDYVCNAGRRWSFKLGGHIEYLDDPVILAIAPYCGYDIARDWDTKDSYLVIGNSVASAFAITDKLAVKVIIDLKYNYPMEGGYTDTLVRNGMSSSITFSFVQKIGKVQSEGGIQRSLAILGQTQYVGSTSYAIPLSKD